MNVLSAMGGIPYIRESLEKRERLQAGNGAGSRILSLEGFGIPPARVVLYGTLILAAMMLVSSAFAGMIATASRVGTMEGNRAIAGAFAFALVLPAQFLIGRGVGRRGAGRGILAVILVAAFGRLLIIVFDRAFMTSDEIAEFVGAGTATQLMAGLALLSAIGLLGYWRGRRQRLAAYLSYLLQDVSEETRNAIVGWRTERLTGRRRLNGLLLPPRGGGPDYFQAALTQLTVAVPHLSRSYASLALSMTDQSHPRPAADHPNG